MSSLDPTDNPPYITVVEFAGVYHVNRVEYDPRADDYMVIMSKQLTHKDAALEEAEKWAKREGLEVR